MSPKQRLEASKKRAARGSEETEPLLLKKKAEVQQAPIPIKAEPTKENLTLLKQTIAKRKAEAQAHAEVSTVIKKVRKTRARTSTLNRIPFSSRTRSRFD